MKIIDLTLADSGEYTCKINAEEKTVTKLVVTGNVQTNRYILLNSDYTFILIILFIFAHRIFFYIRRDKGISASFSAFDFGIIQIYFLLPLS